MVTLGAKLRFPDGNFFGDIAFFPACSAQRPGAVWRQGGDGQRIAQACQHRGGDGFDKIRRGVGDHRRAAGALAVNRLQRHGEEGFTRQGQRLPVPFNQFLAFTAVAFGDSALQLL